jgi:hypothetical protein
MLKKLSIINKRNNSYNKNKKENSIKLRNSLLFQINNDNSNFTFIPVKIFPQKIFFEKKDKAKNLNSEKNKKLSISKTSSSLIKKKNRSFFNKNYIEKSNMEKNYIINLDKCLTQKEKNFRRNVSQQILKSSKLKDQLIDNVSSLRQKNNDNYIELSKSKYSLYDTNKNNIHTLIKDNMIKLENVNNENEIYDLNEDINNMQNEIEKLKKQTILFINYYLEIKDDVNFMKKQCKILPEIIGNLEIENKNLSYMQNTIHSNIQKIKSKLYGFEINKSKIERNLEQLITFYDEYN